MLLQAFRALQGLIMSVLLTAVDDKHSNPLWPAMGYPGQLPPPVLPPLCLLLLALQPASVSTNVVPLYSRFHASDMPLNLVMCRLARNCMI